MKRFWFEFKFEIWYEAPAGLLLGCGVTAIDYNEAISIMTKKIFKENKLPPIIKCIENIDVRTLDQGHVVLNMLPPNRKGIWFSMGYD